MPFIDTNTGEVLQIIETNKVNEIPYKAGQYIITDDGYIYYDSSIGSNIEDRLCLTLKQNIKQYFRHNNNLDDDYLSKQTNPRVGDIVIIKDEIETDRYNSTIYIYNENSENVFGWYKLTDAQLMSNVYNEKDIVSIDGTITLSKGQTISELLELIINLDRDSNLKNNVLTKDNTEAYEPINDYNPATKKFVEDTISTNIDEVVVNTDRTLTELSNKIDEVESLAKNQVNAYVFDTLIDLENWLKIEKNKSSLKIGDDLLVKEKNVPDYWWDGENVQESESNSLVNLDEYVKIIDLNNVIIDFNNHVESLNEKINDELSENIKQGQEITDLHLSDIKQGQEITDLLLAKIEQDKKIDELTDNIDKNVLERIADTYQNVNVRINELSNLIIALQNDKIDRYTTNEDEGKILTAKNNVATWIELIAAEEVEV